MSTSVMSVERSQNDERSKINALSVDHSASVAESPAPLCNMLAHPQSETWWRKMTHLNQASQNCKLFRNRLYHYQEIAAIQT